MDSDSFLQVLKIESDDFVVDEEETILLKVDYWKDMISRVNEKEAFHQEGAKRYGKEEWGWDFDEDEPLFDEYVDEVKDGTKTGKKVIDRGSRLSPSQLETRQKHKETVLLREGSKRDIKDETKLDSFDVPMGEAPQYGPKGEPKKEKESPAFFMDTPSKKVTEKESFLPTKEYGVKFDFDKVSLEQLESKLNSHKYKDLTDDKISERISKLTGQIDGKRKQIESKGRGAEKTYTKAAWKEYQKLISEVKEIEDETNSLPSMPTMEDAKKIRSEKKLENLGLKAGATNAKKLTALKNEYKKDLKEAMNKRRGVSDKKKKIADFNKKFRLGSPHAQNRLKTWIEERDSLLMLIALKSQIAYVKFQNITDKLTIQEPERKDFADVPDSLYSFVSKALSQDDFKQLISIIEKLNQLHEESQGETDNYLEEMKEELSYRGGESEDQKDSFYDFLTNRLEKFFKPIKVHNNAVRSDRKRNIEKHLQDIITFDPENTAFIISEDVIESVNEEVNKKIKQEEDFREDIKTSSNLLDNAYRNVKEFYNKFDYDVSQPRSQSSEDALLFRILSQEKAGMSSQETFDSLEERNFFTDKNLYKLAKIISILDKGRSEKHQKKALGLSKQNKVTNHAKVVKVLNNEYGGEIGHRIFLRILNEHGLDLPSVGSLKDATRDIVSRSTNIAGLEQELIDINNIFSSPSMSDDLSFLMNPSYIQQMLDLAERNYFNTIDDIDADSQISSKMKIERKKEIRQTFARLAYVGQFLNTISRGTEFLYSVNNQIIISNRVLEDMKLTYPELKSQYSDTLSREVKTKIRKIVSGKEIDESTEKPIKFKRPTQRRDN